MNIIEEIKILVIKIVIVRNTTIFNADWNNGSYCVEECEEGWIH